VLVDMLSNITVSEIIHAQDQEDYSLPFTSPAKRDHLATIAIELAFCIFLAADERESVF